MNTNIVKDEGSKDLTGHDKLQRCHLLQLQVSSNQPMEEGHPLSGDDICLTKAIYK